MLSVRGVDSQWVFFNTLDPKRHTHKTTFGAPWRRLVEKCEWEAGYCTPNDLRATYEKYSNMSKEHTDTQREKMSGASMDVQRRIYVSMTADDLKGLERVVQVPGLDKVLTGKIRETI